MNHADLFANPVRLVVKREDTWVVAYMAPLKTMTGAMEVGRMRAATMSEDKDRLTGKSPLFRAWAEALADWWTRELKRHGVDFVETVDIEDLEKPSIVH